MTIVDSLAKVKEERRRREDHMYTSPSPQHSLDKSTHRTKSFGVLMSFLLWFNHHLLIKTSTCALGVNNHGATFTAAQLSFYGYVSIQTVSFCRRNDDLTDDELKTLTADEVDLILPSLLLTLN